MRNTESLPFSKFFNENCLCAARRHFLKDLRDVSTLLQLYSHYIVIPKLVKEIFEG